MPVDDTESASADPTAWYSQQFMAQYSYRPPMPAPYPGRPTGMPQRLRSSQ
jgi:hypothetical protein